MMRWIPISLCLLAVAAVGQAPLPIPVTFAWDLPAKLDNVDRIRLDWPGGFALFPTNQVAATVDNFPLGLANAVTATSVSSSGLTSTNNPTIYVMHVRAIFEESNDPAGPWTAGPETRVLVERPAPLGFFRVRLEIQ